MSDIVEEVARAVYDEVEKLPKYALVQMNGVLAEIIAKAAITALLKAMEEPSEGMKDAGQMGLMAEMHPAAGAYKAMLAKFREEEGL